MFRQGGTVSGPVLSTAVSADSNTNFSTSGTIQLDYAYIHRPESAEISHFHSRQIVLPVSTTVHPSIRCTALNLLRVQALPAVEKYRHRRNMSSTSVGRALAIDDTLEESLQDMDEHSNCLLVLQVENQADRQAFEVVLQTRDGSGGRIKQRIEPGCTTKSVKLQICVQYGRLMSALSVPQLTSTDIALLAHGRTNLATCPLVVKQAVHSGQRPHIA